MSITIHVTPEQAAEIADILDRDIAWRKGRNPSTIKLTNSTQAAHDRCYLVLLIAKAIVDTKKGKL